MKKLVKVTLTIADLASLICDERITMKQSGIHDLEISLKDFIAEDLDDLEAILDVLETEINAIRNEEPEEEPEARPDGE
jgi:hypothetical protein